MIVVTVEKMASQFTLESTALLHYLVPFTPGHIPPSWKQNVSLVSMTVCHVTRIQWVSHSPARPGMTTCLCLLQIICKWTEKGKKEAKEKSRIAIHPVHTYDSSALEVHAGDCKLEANLRDID